MSAPVISFRPGAGLWGIRQWRWLVVAGVVTSLAALPVAIGSLPAAESDISAKALLHRIADSSDVPYTGVAESNAGFRFPDFERAQRLVELFGEKTTMRVWHLDEGHWRVDEIGPIDERGTYSDAAGVWIWNSGRRAAARIEGHPPIRFARASDLLPPDLGRRLAAAAAPEETTRLPALRIAGVHAAGLRIEPRSTSTTVGRVDLWADVATGLPVRVEVAARGSDDVLISAGFLDLELSEPDPDIFGFVPPPDAEVNYTEAPDFVQAVNRYSPFLLPDELGALPRRTSIASAAATYGDGFDLVAALVLGERYSPFRDDELERVPEVTGSFGTGRFLATPLLNGLYIERGDIAYMIGGTVRRDTLIQVATRLITEIENSSFR